MSYYLLILDFDFLGGQRMLDIVSRMIYSMFFEFFKSKGAKPQPWIFKMLKIEIFFFLKLYELYFLFFEIQKIYDL